MSFLCLKPFYDFSTKVLNTIKVLLSSGFGRLFLHHLLLFPHGISMLPLVLAFIYTRWSPDSLPLSARHMHCLGSKSLLKPFFPHKTCPYPLLAPQAQSWSVSSLFLILYIALCLSLCLLQPKVNPCVHASVCLITFTVPSQHFDI